MLLWRNVPLEDGEENVKRGSGRAEEVLDGDAGRACRGRPVMLCD